MLLVAVVPAAAQGASGPVQATDASGAVIKLSKPAKRITCVYGASCWGILASLGLKPVASTPATEDMAVRAYFGAAAANIPTVVWNSVESVASSSPDLIIARQGNDDLVKSESVIAPVFLTANFGLQGIYDSTLAIAKLTNRVAQAKKSIAAFKKTMAALAAKKPKSKNKILKTVAIAEAWQQSGYILAWNTNPVCQVLAKYKLARCPFTGVTAGAGNATAPESTFDPEYVLQVNPDLIAFVGYPGAPAYSERTDPVWTQLKAVQTNKVFQDNVSYSLFGQSLVGIEYATEQILARLYPKQYKKPGSWRLWKPHSVH